MGSGGRGRAFIKGGLGCFGVFLALGIISLMLGGTMILDAGGVALLFVLGGVIGLIVDAIYRRGKRDALRERDLG